MSQHTLTCTLTGRIQTVSELPPAARSSDQHCTWLLSCSAHDSWDMSLAQGSLQIPEKWRKKIKDVNQAAYDLWIWACLYTKAWELTASMRMIEWYLTWEWKQVCGMHAGSSLIFILNGYTTHRVEESTLLLSCTWDKHKLARPLICVCGCRNASGTTWL